MKTMQKQIDEMAKEFVSINFVDWYEKGLINKEGCDFYMALYRNIVNKIIKDSKK